MSRLLLWVALLTLLPLCLGAAAFAQQPPDVSAKANIVEHLGEQVDLDLSFVDAQGQTRPLREYMLPGKPAILTPVYFECPRLCSLTLNGVAKLISSLDLGINKDYRVITLSFDPSEKPALARAKASNYYASINLDAHAQPGWPFLTGEVENVQKLMTQIGFLYTRDSSQWIHAAGIIVLTPNGVISHYVYGVSFVARDLRYALIEASKGAIGSTLDRVFLFCFHFDPQTGKYTPVIWRITQIICGSVVLILIGFVLWLRKTARTRGHR